MRNMLEVSEPAASYSLVTSLNHVAYKMLAYVHSSPLGERASEIGDQLPWLEPVRKVGATTVAYAGGVMLSRASGTITSVDEFIGISGGRGTQLVNPELNAPDSVPEKSLSLLASDRPAQLPDLAPAIADPDTLADKIDNGIDLPANLAEAPPQVDLPKGSTIWTQAVRVAEEMGYADLTEHQKREFTDAILRHNGLTWSEARELPIGHDVEFLSQSRMIDVLENNDAELTNIADRPVLGIDPPPADTLPNDQQETPAPGDLPSNPPPLPNNPLPTEEGNTVYACSAPDPWRGWLTKWDFGCEYNDQEEQNLLMTAILGGAALVTVVTAGGHREYRRRGSLKRRDTVVTSRNRTVGPLPLQREDPRPRAMDPGGILGPPVANSPTGVRPPGQPVSPSVLKMPGDQTGRRISTGTTATAPRPRPDEQARLDEEQARNDEAAAAHDEAAQANKNAKSAKRSARLAWAVPVLSAVSRRLRLPRRRRRS